MDSKTGIKEKSRKDKSKVGNDRRDILGITVSKTSNFPDWYIQTITKAELVDYYDVSGCYILRPNSYFIWEQIQKWMDVEIKKMNVDNVLFPLFIHKSNLEKEEDHINDFSPEVAWVTHHQQSEQQSDGQQDGKVCNSSGRVEDSDIAIRPTSETGMYPYFAKWLQSYRDLPIKVNQWCNIVRWEFSKPTPFIRSREFQWQEGHTAHATTEEAEIQVHNSLRMYQECYRQLLAVDVISGYKTEKEKFAGAEYTTTLEVFIPEAGRGIQSATSHHLGQNFSKMFDISFEKPRSTPEQTTPETTTPENIKSLVHQTSWGFSTRSIGVMIMQHSDNKGLILPPPVAKYQVVIVPTGLSKKTLPETIEQLFVHCCVLENQLKQAGFRAYADVRKQHNPPYKYNYWETRGIPLRLEIGPRELRQSTATFVNRVDGIKMDEVIKTEEDLSTTVSRYLDKIHSQLLQQSEKKTNDNLETATSIKEACEHIKNKKMVAVPFCATESCEESFKENIRQFDEDCQGTKSLCIPFSQTKININENNMIQCFNDGCDTMCSRYTIISKSF